MNATGALRVANRARNLRSPSARIGGMYKFQSCQRSLQLAGQFIVDHNNFHKNQRFKKLARMMHLCGRQAASPRSFKDSLMKSHRSSDKRFLGALVAAVGLWFSGAALADPIGPGCGTCQGAVYYVQYSGTALPDSDPLHETFRIFLTIDTSGLSIPGVFGIGAAAVKVSSSSVGATLFSAPGGTANWTVSAGGINAGGCSGSGSGFNCAGYTGPGAGSPITGSFMTFAFDVTMNNGILNTTPFGSEVKVEYVDASGNKIGALVSEEISLQVGTPPLEVPEPQTLALVGLGLLGVALTRRRRTMR